MSGPNATPKLVGYFSRDSSHEYRIDLSLLRYLTEDITKVVPIDVPKYNVRTYQIDNDKFPFFRFILSHLDIIREVGGNSIMDAPIITKSTALFRLWYLYKYTKNTEDYIFVIHLLKGKIYFLVEKKYEDSGSTVGNAFSCALQSDKPDGEPNTDIDANENFFGVFQLQMKSHTLIYQNIIDCILANTDDAKTPVCDDDETSTLEDLRKRQFVKFKTTTGHPGKKNFIRHKANELWMKAFLGNAKVCVGFRSSDDVIEQIEMYSMQQLHDMNPRFNMDKFFQKLDLIFKNFKKLLTQEATWLNYSNDLYNIPKITIRLSSNEFGKFDRIDVNPEYDLPQWFVEGIEREM